MVHGVSDLLLRASHLKLCHCRFTHGSDEMVKFCTSFSLPYTMLSSHRMGSATTFLVESLPLEISRALTMPCSGLEGSCNHSLYEEHFKLNLCSFRHKLINLELVAYRVPSICFESLI